MSSYFYKNETIGTLKVQSIYEFYEEPRLFSVANSVGGLYLVYWIGSDDTYDNWIIIPISRGKLNTLETKQTCIRDALLYQEGEHFFKLRQPYDDSLDSIFNAFESDTIQEIITLPRQGLYVSNTPQPEEFITDSSPLYTEATHEIHVEKKSKRSKVLLNQVSKIFDSFSQLYDSITDALDVSSTLQPVGARPGSFILSFNSDNFSLVEGTLNELFTIISSKGDIVEFIQDNNIDTSIICDFLTKISDTHSIVDLKRNSDGNSVLKIDASDARFYLPQLTANMVSFVSSSQVPQANDLNKLFEIVEKRATDVYLSPASVSLTERQIQYYLHAALTLGFVKSYGAVTALGRQLAEADHETRLKITARSFQSSHCGWAWIQWSSVSNLRELDATSASDFLLNMCSTLSESTARRRATTLRTWCEQLSPHYSEW